MKNLEISSNLSLSLRILTFLLLLGFPIAAFYLYAGSAFPWWQAWKRGLITAGIVLMLFILMGGLHRVYISRTPMKSAGNGEEPIA